MELLGHDFFMFFNADSHTINVIYRRAKGDYGILVPMTP
jgi:putative sigma-54 modulation protein